tara:strand:+ start:873 stop:1268 length:396 start_codon:yes stop_codon:yes gene_type:complete
MCSYLNSYVTQNVANPEWSKFFVAKSAVVGVNQEINLTFPNLSVALIYTSGFVVNNLVAAPVWILTDIFNTQIAASNGLGGGFAGNTFNYYTDGETLFFRLNNANVEFFMFYQLIYDRKEKVQQPTSSSGR